MDKKTFIRELEQALSVLQEEELNDIISEYEQHIDMKQERGLTEEEAIADFGSLDELTAEILEAYHVRADYAVEKRRGGRQAFGEERNLLGKIRAIVLRLRLLVLAGAEGLGNFLLRIGRFWKRQGGKLGERILIRQGNPGFSGADRIVSRELPLDQERGGTEAGGEKRPEGTRWEGAQGGRQRRKEILPERHVQRNHLRQGFQGVVSSLLSKSVRWMGNILHRCIRIALWGIHMAWNGACIGFSVCCGFLGLFCLYGLGMLTVLLMQGYPLAGVTLGCLGLVMCSFSAACLGLTFLWKRGKGSGDQRNQEESQHA